MLECVIGDGMPLGRGGFANPSPPDPLSRRARGNYINWITTGGGLTPAPIHVSRLRRAARSSDPRMGAAPAPLNCDPAARGGHRPTPGMSPPRPGPPRGCGPPRSCPPRMGPPRHERQITRSTKNIKNHSKSTATCDKIRKNHQNLLFSESPSLPILPRLPDRPWDLRQPRSLGRCTPSG